MLLFSASVAILVYNTFTSASLPQRERLLTTRLQDLTAFMADSAKGVAEDGLKNEAVNQLLGSVTHRVLADAPEVEGGFTSNISTALPAMAFPPVRYTIHRHLIGPIHHPLKHR